MVSEEALLHQAEKSQNEMYKHIFKHILRGYKLISSFVIMKLGLGLTAMHFNMVLKLESLDITACQLDSVFVNIHTRLFDNCT